MKTKIIVALLTLSLSLGISYAQIPVTDGAQISQNVAESAKQLAEMANQLATAKSQLDTALNQLKSFKEEAENMKKRLEGLSNLGDNFKGKDFDGAINELISQINKLENIEKFMTDNKIDTTSKSSVSENAMKHSGYSSIQKELKKHTDNLNALQKEAEQADTPQKREAVANATAVEKARMDAKKEILELEQKKQEEVAAAKKKQEINKFTERANSVPDWVKGGFEIQIDMGNKN